MSLRSLPAVRGGFPWPLTLVGLFTLATGSVEADPGREEARAPLAGEKATFVGAQSCVACHPQTHETWDHSRHSKMVQPATPKSVKGDFSIERIKLRGENYGLRARDGVYYIGETYFTGKKGERRVDYTLGNRRIQQYLTTLEDGRIVVLPPSWDVLRKEWFHNMEIVAPEENDDTPVQVWNKNCFGCHVSSQENHFNLEKKTYRSEWMDFGTTCERCHGPASKHVDRYTRAGSYAGDDNYIVRQTSLDNVTNTMVCAQCHSLRDTMAPGYTAGEDYFDYFMPLLEYSLPAGNDPAWWADGKTRRFSSNALGIWQSECFLKGKVACTTCHVDPHEPEIENNPQLRPTNNTLCTRCHAGMDQDLTAHTHHAPTSEGSSCVECHMPRTVTSIKATMRDHSISIPTPENTIAHGIPNACNLCHGDRSPEWAVETLDEWFPTSTARQKLIDRAAAFSGARAGKPEALDRLVALAANEAQGPLPRANALGYLSRYSDPRVLPALASGLEDPHPLLRAVAAMRFGELEIRSEDFARYGPALASALDNETRIVRMSAAYSLLNLGVYHLDGEAGRKFDDAKRDHAIRAATSPDHAPTQLQIGRLHILNRDAKRAARAFEHSYHLDPDLEGIQYFLALARIAQERLKEARRLLETIDREDPYFERARALLEKITPRH